MIVEQFPPLTRAAVALAPDGIGGQVRREDAPDLKDRVEFGGPLVTTIDERYHPEDADLQAFIRGQADRVRFLIAHMSSHFPRSFPPPLAEASVEVVLEDDTNSGQTVAYSLFPTRAGTSYDLSRLYVLATLTVGPVTAPAWVRRTPESWTTALETSCWAGPSCRPTRHGSFQPTPVQELVGPTRLIMIIQTPKASKGSLSVTWPFSDRSRLVAEAADPAAGGGRRQPRASQFLDGPQRGFDVNRQELYQQARRAIDQWHRTRDKQSLDAAVQRYRNVLALPWNGSGVANLDSAYRK